MSNSTQELINDITRLRKKLSDLQVQVYSGYMSSDKQYSMKRKEGNMKRTSTQDVRHNSDIPVLDDEGQNSKPSALSNSQTLSTGSEERKNSDDKEQEEFLQASNFGRHTGNHIHPDRLQTLRKIRRALRNMKTKKRPYKASGGRLSNLVNAYRAFENRTPFDTNNHKIRYSGGLHYSRAENTPKFNRKTPQFDAAFKIRRTIPSIYNKNNKKHFGGGIEESWRDHKRDLRAL